MSFHQIVVFWGRGRICVVNTFIILIRVGGTSFDKVLVTLFTNMQTNPIFSVTPKNGCTVPDTTFALWIYRVKNLFSVLFFSKFSPFNKFVNVWQKKLHGPPHCFVSVPYIRVCCKTILEHHLFQGKKKKKIKTKYSENPLQIWECPPPPKTYAYYLTQNIFFDIL